ncbi:MAG TPA: fibrobacter succinogenes major paralogous domain-containing protein, partial [Cryomorphaceae bacterium]|nr:fibrobacter succinogenes major paralogous domain-containing protein [Cryomorphaceae bacterium]
SWPHNNSNNEDPYGKIYNGYTIASETNLCPLGWHVATDEDWIEMELFLGMNPSEATAAGGRGGDVNLGGKLKSTEFWFPNDNATNESGFTALPGDVRIESGEFSFMLGSYAYYWTSSESEVGFYNRYMNFFDNRVWRAFGNFETGMSVRCIKD